MIRFFYRLFSNVSFGFLSLKSFKIFDESAYCYPKEIAEGAISEDKSGQDREKILDSQQIKPKMQVPSRRNVLLSEQGEHHDLKEIYQEINILYFEKKLQLPITWFGQKLHLPRSRIRLGSYNQRTRLIKIHKLLDHPSVPRYFISYIVYHEMLHHVLPPLKGKKGRRRVHHREFKEREKQFQDYAKAREFETQISLVYRAST